MLDGGQKISSYLLYDVFGDYAQHELLFLFLFEFQLERGFHAGSSIQKALTFHDLIQESEVNSQSIYADKIENVGADLQSDCNYQLQRQLKWNLQDVALETPWTIADLR